jgi:hypothetical protein
MSLSIANEGMAFNGTKVVGTTAGLAALTLANFDSGSSADASNQLNLYLDNSGVPSADIATDLPTPVALGVISGTKLVVFNDTTGKKVTFIDPENGVTYDFVNKNGEYITLVSDGAQWVIG